MFSTRHVVRPLPVALTLGIASVALSGAAQAQINYDAANSSYFVVGGTNNQIKTNYGNNNVFVGKDSLSSFSTLAGPITLTISKGATIYGKNVVAPDAKTYYGVHVFGGNQVNMTGGFVWQANGHDTSAINVSGGNVIYANGYQNSSMAISGGTVSNVAGYDHSAFNVSGGTVNGVTLNDSSTYNFSGGTVSPFLSIAAYGTSTLSLTGSNFTVTSANERWGVDPTTGLGRVADYTITGTLSDGTAFNKKITASTGGATLAANNVVLRGMSLVQTNPLYFTTDGTANSFASLVTVGRNSDGSVNTSPSVNLEDGLYTGVVKAYNSSQVTMNGGQVVGTLNALGSSTVTMNGGTAQVVYARENGTFNLAGGQVKDTVYGYGHGIVNITGGATDISWAFENSTINVKDGYSRDATSSGGTVNISGGQVDVSYSNGSAATVNISGGTVGASTSFAGLRSTSGGTFNVSGGTIGGGTYSVLGNVNLNVTGGTLTKDAYLYGGNANISGGTLAGLSIGGTATVSGGTIGKFDLFDVSTLNLVGSGFSTTAGAAYWGYNQNTSTLGWVADYTITGNLADGTAFNKTITAAANGSTLAADSIQLQGQGFEVAPDLYVTDNGSVHDAYNSITVGTSEDGSINQSADVTLDTGHISGFVNVVNGSTVTMNDGINYGGIYNNDTSTVNIVGGNVSATVGYGTSITNILGGTVGGVNGTEDSVTNISGGTIGSKDFFILGDTNAVFNLSGGKLNLSAVRLLGNATLDVFGTGLGFAFTGVGSDDFGDYTGYRLFGSLLDGQSISGITLYDYIDGGYDIGKGPDNTPLRFNGTAVAAPEPGSLGLLLVAGLPLAGVIVRRRRIIRA